MSTEAGETGPKPADDDPRGAANALRDLLVSFIRHTPRDMSLTSVLALSTLERTGPRRITDLAVSEGLAQPSMTALVATLVRAGYAERRSDPADRRVVMVAITEAGLALLRTRRSASAEVIADAVGKLSPEDTAALAAATPAIERLHDLLGERPPGTRPEPPAVAD
jgi:DNA-binding MarR family transcriptional regulator